MKLLIIKLLFVVTVSQNLILGSNFSTLHQVAKSFINSGSHLNKSIKDICQTWAFVSNFSTGLEDGEYFMPSNTLFELSSTFVILDTNTPLANPNKTSFFDREVPYENLVNPSVFGALRFIRNKICVFINVNNSEDLLYKLNEILLHRISRAHIDNFIFIGTNDSLAEFPTLDRYQDVRNKYGVVVNHSGERSKNTFINFCSINTEEYEPSDQKCSSLIFGKHFRVTSVLSPGMVRYKNDPETGKRLSGAGIYFVIFEDASFRYNFTFDIRYAEPGGASGFKKDGAWKGAVGEVFARKMDIGFCTAITAQRHHIVDPSVLTNVLARVFYIRQPSPKTSWQSIFWPLHIYVWYAIIGTFLAALPTYYLSIRLSYTLSHQEHRRPPDNLLSNVAMILLQIFVEQGLSIQYWRGFVLRSLILLWILFSYVIGTGYRGNLVSFLTFLERDEIPKTHNELSLSHYKLLFRYYGGVAYSAVLSSSDPKHKRIVQKSFLVNTSLDCILPALRDNNIACLDYDFTADHAIATNGTLEPTNSNQDILIRSSEKDSLFFLVWTFRKHSPLFEFFDKVILFSHSSGLADRWIYEDRRRGKFIGANWLKEQVKSPVRSAIIKLTKSINSGPKPMDLTSLRTIFLIGAFGYGVASILFLVENLTRLFRKLKKMVHHQSSRINQPNILP